MKQRRFAIWFSATVSLAGVMPSPALAQTLVLGDSSVSLGTLPASRRDLVQPTAPLGPAVPSLSTNSEPYRPPGTWDPADAIGSISLGDGGPDILAGTIYFTVDRASVGLAGTAPNVASEVAGVLSGVQGEASGDIFATNDPASAVGLGANTQVVDADGSPIAALSYYGGLGLGLSEHLAVPGPPMADEMSDFDWSAAGVAFATVVQLSLAPGSPSLDTSTPSTVWNWGQTSPEIWLGSTLSPPLFGNQALAEGDVVDALYRRGSTVYVSLTRDSPSVLSYAYSAADILNPNNGVVAVTAAQLGLAWSDNVTGLDVVLNPCPGTPYGTADVDGDGVKSAGCTTVDNCPTVFNIDQDDTDGDGLGDACDPCTDTDGDGRGNPYFPANICTDDLCPKLFTESDVDADADGIGDDCDECVDADDDGYGTEAAPYCGSFPYVADNCPDVANPDQLDTDGDGVGDACDPCTDIDGDGLGAGLPAEICPPDDCTDFDHDGVGEGLVGESCGTDNCPSDPNPTQGDADDDGVGDACDNCPLAANPSQDDSDASSDSGVFGDACDTCNAGVYLHGVQLRFGRLDVPGSQKVVLKGWSSGLPGAVDPYTDGMRIVLVDRGNLDNAVLDVTLPGGGVPNACGPRDGWKRNASGAVQKYSTATGVVPPACTDGSSRGLTKILIKNSAVAGTVLHKIVGKRSTYSPLVGPFVLTVVYGDAAQADAGECASRYVATWNCALLRGGTSLRCATSY